ncbi:MAG: glycoside hydrolase family 5 protein [Clostridiales bacterium]|nr:glycoside hydrolase family 5 protein [Clostridiales bacterium]
MKKRLLSAVLATIMAVTCLSGCGSKDKESKAGTMREITTMEITKEMGVGINLGNTFEAQSGGDDVYVYETAWGSPEITKEIIKGYADEGFGVLRVPVAWSNMMGEDYTISEEYLKRVTQVIDWAIDDGMYVIVNIHWDGGWWEKFPTEKEECMKKFTRIWEQLSEAYKNHSDYLMFEALNEEGGWNEMWNRYGGNDNGKAESYGLLNEINQKFVDIVRASGGNNKKRHLLIAGYVTDVELTCDELFVMPNDPQNRCAVSVHYYTPSTLCILEEDADWGKARTEWGTASDYEELEKYMNMVKETFIDKGIPVILGEYSVAAMRNKTEDVIRTYVSAVCESSYKKGICPVLWDTTGSYYDRSTCKFIDQKLLENFMAVLEGKEMPNVNPVTDDNAENAA